MTAYRELLGVYDADGGLRGEVTYIVGHLLHRRECALCDITHTWRRKPEWDAMTATLGTPFTLLHRNEVTDASARAVAENEGLPVVLGLDFDGTWHPVLRKADLEKADGSVAAFEGILREVIVPR